MIFASDWLIFCQMIIFRMYRFNRIFFLHLTFLSDEGPSLKTLDLVFSISAAHQLSLFWFVWKGAFLPAMFSPLPSPPPPPHHRSLCYQMCFALLWITNTFLTLCVKFILHKAKPRLCEKWHEISYCSLKECLSQCVLGCLHNWISPYQVTFIMAMTNNASSLNGKRTCILM